MSLRQVIFFDEARKVFKKDYKSDIGTPYVDLMVTQIRESGVGLIISDQIPHLLSEAAKSNCYVIIAFSLTNGKDIEDIARTMRLTEDQADMLNKLEVGQGIVKLAGRYPEPFPIVIPYVPIESYVSDEEVASHMKPILDSFKIKPRTPLSEVLAKGEKEHVRREERERERPDDFKVGVDEVKRARKDEARDFMISIEKYPFLSVTERYTKLGLSAYRGNKIQKELVETGYIVEVRKGKSVYLELTDKGRGAIGSPDKKIPGKGSMEHRLYQQKIKEYYEGLGYIASIEKDLYGKSIDVLVNKAGKLVAIEIELNITDHIIENISKDFTVGVDEVVIVTKKEMLSKIMEKVEKALDIKEIKYLSFEVIDNLVK